MMAIGITVCMNSAIINYHHRKPINMCPTGSASGTYETEPNRFGIMEDVRREVGQKGGGWFHYPSSFGYLLRCPILRGPNEQLWSLGAWSSV